MGHSRVAEGECETYSFVNVKDGKRKWIMRFTLPVIASTSVAIISSSTTRIFVTVPSPSVIFLYFFLYLCHHETTDLILSSCDPLPFRQSVEYFVNHSHRHYCRCCHCPRVSPLRFLCFFCLLCFDGFLPLSSTALDFEDDDEGVIPCCFWRASSSKLDFSNNCFLYSCSFFWIWNSGSSLTFLTISTGPAGPLGLRIESRCQVYNKRLKVLY